MEAPDDELRHDNDPEETYGVMLADRSPKPAFDTVTDMYAEGDAHATARTIGGVILAGMVLTAASGWMLARRRYNRRASLGPPT